MIKWDDVVKKALEVYLHRDKYAYWYGAKGQILTEEVMDSFIASEPAYFKKYTPERLQELKDWSRGKIGLDCSGFTGYVTGCHMYSTAQINACTNITDKYNAPAGAILYTTFGGTGRHVALDIGYGYCLSMDREGESLNLHRHKENTIPWEKAGRLTGYVDYDGATNR